MICIDHYFLRLIIIFLEVDVMQMPEREKKIPVNDPCPCGSEKKYKKCHGSDLYRTKSTPGQMDGRIRQLTSKSHCFAPDSLKHECARGTINAHTISRSGSLGAIEENGHVYSYNVSVQGIDKASGKIIPERTGWRKASTFPGFCSIHDKKLFSPLEDEEFAGTKEQCFLLAYRCIARELYTKNNSNLQATLRKTLSAGSKALSAYMSDFNFGTALGLRDSKAHKAKYDTVLESKEWSKVRGVLFEFDGVFPIQCAAGFFPDEDVYGRRLQELGNAKVEPQSIALVSFSADNKSYFLLCWLEDSDIAASAFSDSLRSVPELDMPAVIGSMLLQVSDNCHFSPSWYTNLSSIGKKWCADKVMIGVLPVATPPIAKNIKNEYFSNVSIRSVMELIN